MKATLRILTICFFLALLFLPASRAKTLALQKAKSGASELAGQWKGSVTAGDATMGITLELKTEGDKFVGQINNPHGSWTITDVKFAGGKWTLAWRTPEGGTGKLIGALKDYKLAGDWDFSPAFVGTFELTKAAGAAK